MKELVHRLDSHIGFIWSHPNDNRLGSNCCRPDFAGYDSVATE
jgi:hypothetical protein